jgi:hypothetical protein
MRFAQLGPPRSVSSKSALAFLIVLAMTLGLILPRMLFEQFRPAGRSRRVRGKPLSPFSH